MIIILGAGRNGSTLLMRLLDGSPGLWVYPLELNYLSVFESDAGRTGHLMALPARAETEQRQRFLSWAFAQVEELRHTYLDRVKNSLPPRPDSLKVLSIAPWSSPQECVVTFLDAIREAYDDRGLSIRPALVFKSTEAGAAPVYDRHFPQARFLHIVRHPLANYASLKRTDLVLKEKPFWYQGGDMLRTFLEGRWIPHAHYVLHQCTPGNTRHLLIRYEDLVSHPEQTVAQICQWIGVEPPADPALQTILGGKRIHDLPTSSSMKGVGTPSRVVANMASVFGYEDVITKREKDFIAFRTERLAQQLGYSFERRDALPGLLAMLWEWLVPDRWELMNTAFRIGLARALIRRRLYIWRELLHAFRRPAFGPSDL